MYIDLAPFLNPSPYVVPEDMSLTKVGRSFDYVLSETPISIIICWEFDLFRLGIQSFPATWVATSIRCSPSFPCDRLDHQKGFTDWGK